MLGLVDYGSSDEEIPVPTVTNTTKHAQVGVTNSGKRVVNISLPLSFGTRNNDDDDDDDEDEIDTRPAKKASAGSTLSNLLPAPKNFAPIKKSSSTATPTPSQPKPTTKSTPIIKNAGRPVFQLHTTTPTSSHTSAPPYNEEDIPPNFDESFFPTANSSQSSSSHQQAIPPSHNSQAPCHPCPPQAEHQPQSQPQSQSHSQPAYPPQSRPQSYQAQQTPYYEDKDDPYYVPQGIERPYQSRKAKREMEFQDLGANVIEVNQKDMLSANRPGFSETARLAEIRRAKMNIGAPRPSKLQRSRHQLTAMIYEAQQNELDQQERAILDRGRF